MAPLPTAAVSRTLAQAVRRNTSQSVRALSSTAARSVIATGEASDTYQSPFKGYSAASKVPDFSKYMLPNGSSNQLIGYFMVGTLGAISAAGAKSTVQGEFDSPYEYDKRYWIERKANWC
jgi:ubiquinol-cytochrome c reductase iron-sulfur subunit